MYNRFNRYGDSGETLIDRWDWQNELRNRHISPIRGTQVTPTAQTNAPPLCGRNIDSTVVAGTPDGVPIADASVTAVKLGQNPYPGTPPSFQVAPHNGTNSGIFDYVGSGSGAYDAVTSFLINPPPSMPGQTLGIKPPWLDFLRMYAVPTGSPFDSLNGVGVGSAKVDITARTDGAYNNIRIPGFSAGVQYDIYCAFVDHAGQPGAAVLIGTTNANPLVVAPTQGAAVPSGFAWSATASSINYFAGGAGAYTCTFDVALNITNYGSGLPSLASWMAKASVLAAPSGTPEFTELSSFPPIGTSAHIVAPGLGAGQTYDIKLRLYAQNSNSYTDSGVLFTTVAQGVSNSSLQGMPSSIKTNGPTITGTPSMTTRENRLGFFQSASVTFAESDFTTTKPSWLSQIMLAVRINGDTDHQRQVFIDPTESTTGSYTKSVPVMSGETIDVGVCYIDNQGAQSAIVWPSQWSASSDPKGPIVDPGTNTIVHNWHSPAVQGVIDGAGTLDVSTARTGKILPRANTHASITSIVALDGGGNPKLNVAPAGGVSGQIGSSNLAGASVTQSQVGGNQAVAGSNLISSVYSTNQANTYQGVSSATAWANSSGTLVTPGASSVLTSGASYYWNTGSAAYVNSASPYMAQYALPANSNAIFVFQHNAFQSGAVGKPRVMFSGTSASGSSTTITSSGISGSSTCSDGGSGTYDPGSGGYIAPYHWSSTNGSVVTHQVTTTTGPSASNPIKIQLTSVTCPVGYGSSSLKIWLTKNGVTITSGITIVSGSGSVSSGTVNGVTGPVTIQYAPSVTDSATTYTWNIQAIDYNPQSVGDVPYNESFQCTWSGSVYYWTTTSASGNTFVYAADGTTQRTSTSDSDVQMLSITADTLSVKVFNNASSQLSFSIGMDVSGL